MKPYYETKLGRLYCANCLDILPELELVQLILTDPPYGTDFDYYSKGRGGGLAKPTDYGSQDWNKKRPDKSIFDLIRLKSTHQIIFGGNLFSDYLPPSTSWIVWDKDNGGNNFGDCELAWTSHKKSIRKFKWRWNGMLKEAPEKRYHPCLPAGEKVFFNNEWKNIENVKIGESNRYGKVIDISSHYAEKLIEIKSDKLKTVATYNHPFLVKRLKKIYWICAENIKNDDYILTKAFVYNTLKPSNDKIKRFIWKRRIGKQKKDISGLQKMKMEGSGLNIVLFGKNIMGKFLHDCKYIIKILTRQTTIFPILSLSLPLSISGYTLVADLSKENGKSLARYAENIKNAIKKIGIILVGGLMGKYAKNVISKNHLKQERFLSRRVGSVKIINQKTKVYNLTIDNIPVFDTEIGISHNTQKPVGLFMLILNKYSEPTEPTDIICDPFSGSGTTGIACERLNRKYILIEREEKYCAIAKQRIQSEISQLKMF